MNWVVIKKDPLASEPRWDVVSIWGRMNKAVESHIEKHVAAMRAQGAEIGVVDLEYAKQDPFIRFPEEE